MSRLTTKQRRARLWRRSWVRHVRLLRADPPPFGWRRAAWDALAPDAASYCQSAERHAGFKVPLPFINLETP
jgi:hypothetical protein